MHDGVNRDARSSASVHMINIATMRVVNNIAAIGKTVPCFQPSAFNALWAPGTGCDRTIQGLHKYKNPGIIIAAAQPQIRTHEERKRGYQLTCVITNASNGALPGGNDAIAEEIIAKKNMLCKSSMCELG